MSTDQPLTLSDDINGMAAAAKLLADGGLVALPTETVYGLGADARNDAAVGRIYAAKGRPGFNPLIVHVPDMATAERYAAFNEMARALAQSFWPGPMTLVLPLKEDAGLSPLVTAGLPTVALRVPAHPVMRTILAHLDGPIAAPSANPSGRISATSAAHVLSGLGTALDAVVDAGPCKVGLESTILAPREDGVRLLREGGLARETVERVTGPLVEDATPGQVEAPGQLSSHYAPHAPLMIGGVPRPNEVSIGFGDLPGDLTLSSRGDLSEAARNLFAVLHKADHLARERQAAGIRVAPVPEHGLGRAINDRLRRAAAPRPGSRQTRPSGVPRGR